MLDDITAEWVKSAYPEYNIEQHIHTGGQKAVYKGRNGGQDVVVKIILMENQGQRKRAEREIMAMERIDHPNMVDLLDYFADELEGNPIWVLIEEFIEGNTLRDELEEAGPSLDIGLTVTATLLHVLQEFDEQNIVHRDVKPENIIIRPGGEVVLLDVGIARFLTETSLTPTFAPRGPGTVGYASPEQMNNEKELQDARTDLFSTGIVLAEAITGEHPFDLDGMDIHTAIMNDRKRALTEMAEFAVGPTLQEFYETLTQHEPYQRYRKPAFALDDLLTIKENNDAV